VQMRARFGHDVVVLAQKLAHLSCPRGRAQEPKSVTQRSFTRPGVGHTLGLAQGNSPFVHMSSSRERRTSWEGWTALTVRGWCGDSSVARRWPWHPSDGAPNRRLKPVRLRTSIELRRGKQEQPGAGRRRFLRRRRFYLTCSGIPPPGLFSARVAPRSS
jgi:hypothetical protein